MGGDVLLEAAYIRYNGPMEHQILQEKPASGWKTLVMAFGDVVRSPSWPVKMLQMGLVSVVPVFGAVVLNGYLLGWARDAAWGRTEPLPARLFGNEDGALYRRGWYAFVISLVYGLALALVYAACVSLSQSAFPAAVGQPAVLDLYAYAQQRVAIHPILLAVYYAASLVISPFMLVSMMRMSIYGRLGAGLQFGRVLAMVRKGLASIAVIVVVTALAEEAVSALSGPLSDAALVGAARSACDVRDVRRPRGGARPSRVRKRGVDPRGGFVDGPVRRAPMEGLRRSFAVRRRRERCMNRTEATVPMNRVVLGSTGIVSPQDAFGALPIQRISFDEAERLLRRAVDGGMSFFDTARAYSDSEEKMGRALHGLRDRVAIATKTMAKTPEDFWDDLHTSLRNLRTDHVDLYQFHCIDRVWELGDGTGMYECMVEAKRQGKINDIGVTAHKVGTAFEAVETGLYETMQFPFNYLSSPRETELVSACERKNMGFIAMKGLAGGLLMNADALMAHMACFPNALPIWGIQRLEELETWLSYIEEGQPRMSPEWLRPSKRIGLSWQARSAVAAATAPLARRASSSTSAPVCR